MFKTPKYIKIVWSTYGLREPPSLVKYGKVKEVMYGLLCVRIFNENNYSYYFFPDASIISITEEEYNIGIVLDS